MGDAARTLRVGRRPVEIHRPEKVLYPAEGEGEEYTKGDLIAYYRAVAPFMQPHLRGRPLMLERHPDGLDGPMFMQKNTPEHYPDWIERVEVPKEGGTVVHTVCEDTATLIFLADQACLTLHRWLSRVGSIDPGLANGRGATRCSRWPCRTHPTHRSPGIPPILHKANRRRASPRRSRTTTGPARCRCCATRGRSSRS